MWRHDIRETATDVSVHHRKSFFCAEGDGGTSFRNVDTDVPNLTVTFHKAVIVTVVAV